VLALFLVIDVAAVVFGLLEVQMLDRLAAGENVPDSEIDASDTRVGMIGLGQGALWVACAITFISWMHRAYSNVDALPPAYRRYATGWAIGSWFVPILNFFRPKQIINDIWRSGHPAGDGPPAWLMLWWIGFLISGILGRIAMPDLAPDPSLEQLRTDSVNFIVSDGFDIAVLALAILVVRVTTKRQEAKAASLGVMATGPAATPEPAAEAPATAPGSSPADPADGSRPA